MVGANYTGGRRNAAKARSKDTTGRLQRGHFSKQRLGILTDALRSRRTDHQPMPRPYAAAANSNLTTTPRSLISPSGYSTCTPVATVYDISLGHAKRDLAQKQLQLRQSAQHDSHLHRNDTPLSPSPQPERSRSDQVTTVESSTLLALTGKAESDLASSPETLPPANASPVGHPCATSPPHPESAFCPALRPEKHPTPATEVPPKPRSRILDLIDTSDRKHLLPASPAYHITFVQHTT
jgi:hypothetical protein